jgi:hypothetical protein
MLQHQDQQRKLAAANQLAQGGNGWGGIGEILGAALGAYKSNKLAGEADQTGMQINDQLSQLQAQQEAEIQRIAQEKAEREYRRKRQDKAADREAEFRNQMELTRYKVDNSKSNAPVVNVNSGKAQGAWDETLAKENVKSYIGWRDDAGAAKTTLDTINQIEPMITAMETGKLQEVAAIAGQIWGSDKAADMQSVQALTGDLVMNELSRLKGTASDKEMAFINNLQASYDKTPAANKRILDYIKSKSEASINRFIEADNFRKENGNLQGYTPSFQGATFGGQQAQQQVKPPSEMSNEELMQAIMGGN